MADLTTADASAIERARQRALDGGGSQRRTVAPASVQPTSQRIIEQPDGTKVPEAYYSLNPDQQREFKRLVKEAENLATGETHFDRVSLAVLEQQSAQAKRISDLERLVESLVGENMELRRRQDEMDLSIQIAKSEALLEQQAAIGQDIANLSAIRAEAADEMADYNRQREAGAAESREQLEAQATAITAFKSSTNGTMTMVQERSNAVVSQLASIEPKVQQLDVKTTEIENRNDAIGNPITRPEMRSDITTAVTAELKAQAPEMVNQAIEVIKQDEFGNKSIFGQRMDGDLTRQRRADADAASNIR